MDIIMQNIRQLNVYSPQETDIHSYIEGMGADGSWADINYEDKANTWQPQKHYNRLLAMSYAYICPENTYYKDGTLYDKILSGIQYWLALKPRSNNWYHNQIDEPSFFGLILIAMRDGYQKLSTDIEAQIFERWCHNGSNPAVRTGSNRSEMSLHWMYFGCLMEAGDTLDLALNYIFEPVDYTEEEGLQVDHSFLQHGPQLYIGGYGEVMMESVLKTAVCVKGTHYSLSGDKLQILRSYVLNSYSNVIRGEVMHWNAIGRQISRPDFLRYPERRIPILEMMKETDSDYVTFYDVILKRLQGTSTPDEGVSPYHIHFYRGDYTIHNRPGYSFATRMVSSRTCRQESINGENLLGYYLSDGSTVITSSGKEYLDLMPLWDWNKIPGVTAPIMDTIPVSPSMTTYGIADFAGGVSDSLYGCTGYKYFDEYSGVNTGASKGYFFFDDEVVCLGAGITSDHDEVVTTINQCWGRDNFIAGTTDGYDVYEGDVNQIDAIKYNWALHDGIGYYFPETQNVRIENKEKEGNWSWISTMWADESINGKVFTIGVEHTSPVKDDSYAYYIIPNSTTTSLIDYAKHKNVEILANTDSVQIVYHKGNKLYECLFYRACSYKGDVDITSFQPSAMLIKESSDGYLVHIADPTQSKRNMTIGFKGVGLSEMVYGTVDYSEIDNQYAGMTITAYLNNTKTSVNGLNLYSEPIFSLKDKTLVFNTCQKGNYSLMGIDGVRVENGRFDSNTIKFGDYNSGYYFLRINLEGNRSTIIRKIIIK